MRSEISEFSYGFVITAELRDRLFPGIVAAPVFPTLRAEARLGWDVKIPMRGLSLFLQFKIADALVRAGAAQWGYYGAPYYRIALHRRPRSDQHNRLRALAAREPWVFYVAPCFRELRNFNRNYTRATVVGDSAWIPLRSLPPITDNDQHYITYRTGRDVRFFSPEEVPVREAFDGKLWLERLSRDLESQGRLIDLDYVLKLRESLLVVLRETHTEFIPELSADVREEIGPLRDLIYLSRTFFGAELMFVGQRIS